MSNSWGNNIRITLFGESHGPVVGATLDGVCAGIKIDEAFIEHQMNKRKPQMNVSTTRIEEDKVHFISGVFEGYTTGSPITIIIENKNINSKVYNKNIMRPSHGDYALDQKYLGYQDYRGSGHFSGRLTAAIVAVGAICLAMLKEKNIRVASHIKSIGNICDDSFDKQDDLLKIIDKVDNEYFALIDDNIKDKMMALITQCKDNLDSVGGVIESVVYNLPSGVGSPLFDSIEGVLAQGLYAIGGIKAVEFGEGIRMSRMRGSEANDQMTYVNEKVCFLSNNNGGINAGISNGMTLIIKSYIKPTPSIGKMQKSIDIINKENVLLNIEGRHDPCIVHRVRVVIDSIIAIGICDLLVGRFGELYFNGGKRKCEE